MTILSTICRQLAVLVLVNASVTSFAQPAPGARAAVINGGTMTAPAMTNDKPLMFVKSLSISETKRNDSKFLDVYLNPDLSVGFQYNYRFTFDFGVKTNGAVTTVPDGYYLLNVATFMKAAIRTKSLKIPANETLEQRFVTINKPTVVHVVGGIAKPEISLRFDNPTQGALTNTLYVEFKPLTCPTNQKCLELLPNGDVDTTRSQLNTGFATYLLSTPWVPSNRQATGDADPNEKLSADSERLTNVGLRNFAQTVRVDRAISYSKIRPAPTTPAAYAAANHLALIDFNDPRLYKAGLRYMKEDVRQTIYRLLKHYGVKPVHLTDDKIPMRSAFCSVISQLNSPYTMNPAMTQARARMLETPIEKCRHEEDLIQIRRNLHVGRVNPWEFAIAGEKRPFKNPLMQNVTSGRSHDESASTIVSAKPWTLFTATVFKVFPMVGIIAKDFAGAVDVSHLVTTSNSRNRNESGISSSQTYIDVTPVVITAHASRVQACLEVRMMPGIDTSLYNAHEGATNGFYVCLDTVPSAMVEEIHMHAVTSMANTSIATPSDREDQSLNLLVRGDSEISEFYRVIKSALSPVAGSESAGGTRWPDWYTDEADRYFANRTRQATNVISSPVVIGDKNEGPPSFLSKMFGMYEEKFSH